MDRFKFRAWEYKRKIMYYNVGVFPDECETLKKTNCYGVTFNKHWKNITLMQCTGLKDKNDKLIYEGDILRKVFPAGFDTGKVSFGKYYQDGSGGEYGPTECLGLFIDPIRLSFGNYSENESILQFQSDYNIEIIGNIYENPELLKRE